MVQKKITLRTRPFQPFFLAATDLLDFARPLFDEIEKHRKQREQTGVVGIVPRDVWQREKSLSIGSFMVKYAGLEALVNCCIADFEERKLAVLSEDYFVGPLAKARKTLLGKQFNNWHLASRVFLILPLCSDPEIDPRQTFDVNSPEWKKFEETIQIRHSFSHAESGKTEWLVTQAGPKRWLANDQDPANFWPTTNTPRDHTELSSGI